MDVMAKTVDGISVIIGTRNRHRMIVNCIDAILENNYCSPYEILVIDQSDGSETEIYITTINKRAPHIRYVKMNIKGRTKALNLGINMAKYQIVAFTDDDCLVQNDWLQVIYNTFIFNLDISIITGHIQAGYLEENAFLARSVDNTIKPRRIFQGRLTPHLFVLGGGNSAFRKSVFSSAGLFDENFGKGARFQSGDDCEMGYRLLKSGFSILSEPRMVVIHRSWRGEKEDLVVGYEYGMGTGAFLTKFWLEGDVYAFLRLITCMVWTLSQWVKGLLMKNNHLQSDSENFLAGYLQGIKAYNDFIAYEK